MHADACRAALYGVNILDTALSACRCGNVVSAPAADDIVVRLSSRIKPDKDVEVFDMMEETVIQYTLKEAGKFLLDLMQ